MTVTERREASEILAMKILDHSLIRDAVLKAAERKGYDRIKRVMDLAIAIFMVTFLSPLWVLIAVLIKLTSKGPVLYSGMVVGKREIPFKYYKCVKLSMG